VRARDGATGETLTAIAEAAIAAWDAVVPVTDEREDR
jgi:hypothetical protein